MRIDVEDLFVRIPRASGGVPVGMMGETFKYVYSPRKRGCSFRRRFRSASRPVFPAQAGVFLFQRFLVHFECGIPRASGGVPGAVVVYLVARMYSPRKRGCSLYKETAVLGRRVFPAQAGVFPR